MSSFVLTALSLTLGLLFIFIGTLKLTPAINDEIYKEMRKNYIRSAKVFPLVSLTGWTPNPHMMRKVIGSLEVVAGVLLALIPGQIKQVANVILIVLMVFACYLHFAMAEPFEKLGPVLVFGLLLVCRLTIYLQTMRRQGSQAQQKKTK